MDVQRLIQLLSFFKEIFKGRKVQKIVVDDAIGVCRNEGSVVTFQYVYIDFVLPVRAFYIEASLLSDNSCNDRFYW